MNTIEKIRIIIEALQAGVKVSKKTTLFGILKAIAIITGILALNYDNDPATVFTIDALVYALLDLVQSILTRDVDKSSEDHDDTFPDLPELCEEPLG